MPMPHALTVSLCLALASILTPPPAAAAPPNIVVILADDIGAKELGCYGNTEHNTPHLDRLAAEGMRFDTCYVTPICTSTRIMVMSGQYGFRNGWFNFIGRDYTPLPSSPEYDVGAMLHFSDLAASRGYATALVGKWQLTGRVPTLIHECGFDEYRIWAYAHNLPQGVVHSGGYEDKARTKPARYWHPSILENGRYLPTEPDDYGPDLFHDFAVDFIRRHKDRPFLLYYPHLLTHSPYLETPDPHHPGRRWPKGFKSNVEYLDYSVGRLVQAIDDLGLKDNTLVFFIGDNGTGGSGKGTVTELGVRVPFIVRCPGTVQSGVVSRELTSGCDIFATVAALVGADVPADRPVDGINLLPILRGQPGPRHDWIFSYLGRGRILRDQRWLLEDNGNGRVRLFDCGDSRDGSGYRDVSGLQEPEVLAALRRFERLLGQLPGPDGHPHLKLPDPQAGKPAAKGRRRPS